jgi:hypothetical protein
MHHWHAAISQLCKQNAHEARAYLRQAEVFVMEDMEQRRRLIFPIGQENVKVAARLQLTEAIEFPRRSSKTPQQPNRRLKSVRLGT